MAKIKVDHSKFENAAVEIEKYVDLLKKKMSGVQAEVDGLSASWQGFDYNQYKNEFNKINNNDSVHVQTIKAMESYAKYLRFASDKYKEAQTKAINRANKLSRG